MLVLSRREGEEIVIGGQVRVRVAKIRGNRVQVAVQAPASVPIFRGEVKRKQQTECFETGINWEGASELPQSLVPAELALP